MVAKQDACGLNELSVLVVQLLQIHTVSVSALAITPSANVCGKQPWSPAATIPHAVLTLA